jgi:S-adenosylhomocysteine hydrolase
MVIDRYPELVAGIKGLSEETTGVHRLKQATKNAHKDTDNFLVTKQNRLNTQI